MWGLHHADLFVSPINNQLPRYMTWKPTPGAIGYDALQHDWKNLGNIYLCPPPPVESYPDSSTENPTGRSQSHNSDTELDNSNLMPNGKDDVQHGANSDPTIQDSASPRKRTTHSVQESPQVTLCLGNKRQRLMGKGWDANTASIIVDSPNLRQRQQKYSSIQQRYITWTSEQGIDPKILQQWVLS
ncbi:hypothetical protein BGZ46_006790 [Entomortierella lignicola]|nr:hypothetical protein BGZ46_006790 [Entomortierella lignicola]